MDLKFSKGEFSVNDENYSRVDSKCLRAVQYISRIFQGWRQKKRWAICQSKTHILKIIKGGHLGKGVDLF